MKRFSTILAALALVVSMQGCDNGPSVEPEIPDNPTTESKIQLRLTGSIGQTTRVNEAGFEADDEVGVFISDNGTLANSGNFVNNTPFTYNNGEINAPEGGEVYWESSDTSLDIYAYYPYNSTITSVTEYPFAVEYMQNTKEGFYNSDFIYASALDIAPQKTAVDLKFKHALTKINIILTAGNGVTEEELIAKEKEIQLLDLITRGTIDLSTGIATPGNSTSTIYPYNETGTLKYSAIVFPQERPYYNALIVCLEMDGKRYEYKTDVSYEAGTEYTYTFEIEDNELCLTSSDIEKWTEGDVFQAEFEQMVTGLSYTFKQYLLDEVIYTYNAQTNKYEATENPIDANGDRSISVAEARNVIYINTHEAGVTSLDGIGNFVNLEYLNCGMTSDGGEILEVTNTPKLTSLDLSKNIKLKQLDCSRHNLTSLDLSNNKVLQKVSATHGILEEINIENCSELQSLSVNSNNLSSIDVSGSPLLTYLSVDYNEQLSTLILPNNNKLQYLYFDNTKISELDITKNRRLRMISCSNSLLTNLDISSCVTISDVYCLGCNIPVLDFSDSSITQVTVKCGASDINKEVENPKIILRANQELSEYCEYEGELEIERVD